MNNVNRPVTLRTAHKLRSAAAALLADSEAQSDPRLADSLMYEAGEITKRAALLEEQARPDEPTAFGSLVRAGRGGSDRVLWHPTTFHGKHYWMSETGVVEVWSELTDVEVLRVGLGDTPGAEAIKDAQADAFRAGERSGSALLAGKIHQRLRALLAEAITGERKNAFEKAIQAVEDLAP